MLSSAVFADAKSDCIKALREARAAGLPLTAAELPKPKPSPDIVDMEAIAREVRPIFAKYGKRKFKIQQDWEKEFGSKRDVKVLTKRKKSDAELNECDKQLLVIANRLTVRQFTPRYASPAKMDEKFHSLSYLRSVLSNLLRVKVDEANRESKKGNLTRAVNHLTEARRLPRLALVNAMFLNALQCAGVEKEFYQRVDKMIKEDPSLAKNLPMDLVVPIANFLPVQILVEEFVFTMGQNESFNQPTKEFPGVFIPKDARSLELTTKSIRNVTIYFKKIRNAKNFREAERAYSEVEPNLARAKSNIQGETDYVLGVAIIFEGIDMLQDINKTRNALTHLLGAAKNK